MFVTLKQHNLEINGLKQKIGDLEERVARLERLVDEERLKNVPVAEVAAADDSPGDNVRLFDVLSEKAAKALADGGYNYLHQLDGKTDDELLSISGIGPAKLAEIRDAQKAHA